MDIDALARKIQYRFVGAHSSRPTHPDPLITTRKVPQGGVGFFIHEHLYAHTQVHRTSSTFLMWLRINMRQGARPVFVGCFYALDVSYNKSDVSRRYALLSQDIQELSEEGSIIVLGDFNAHAYHAHARAREHHNTSVFRNLLTDHDLDCLNWRKARGKHSFVRSPTKGTMVDYIIATSDVASTAHDVTIHDTMNFLQTDHRPVSAYFPFNSRQNPTVLPRRYMLSKVEWDEFFKSQEHVLGAEEFLVKLTNLAAQGAIEEMWSLFSGTVLSNAHEIIPVAHAKLLKQRLPRRHQWSPEIANLHNKLATSWNTWQEALESTGESNATDALKEEYREARRMVHRQSERHQKTIQLAALEQNMSAVRKDPNSLFTIFNPNNNNSSHIQADSIRGEGGSVLSGAAALPAWEAAFTPTSEHLAPESAADKAFASATKEQCRLARTSTLEDGELDKPIELQEVKDARKRLRRGTAGQSRDGLIPEFLGPGTRTLPNLDRALHILFSACWKYERVPQAWKCAVIVPLHKRGDPLDPSNFRPISLLDVVSKLFSSIIQRRLCEHLEAGEHISPHQHGFRRGYSTADCALAMSEIIQQRWKDKLKTFVCFVDIRKAYDTVWHDGLFLSLMNRGVKGHLLRVLMSWYEGGTSRVRVNNNLSEPIPMNMGIRQGNVNSTLEYIVFMDELCRELEASSLGVHVKGVWVGALFYADDFVLLAETAEQLQRLLDIVQAHSLRWQYRVSCKKTHTMVFSEKVVAPEEHKWSIYGEELKQVESLPYLGFAINSTLSWTSESKKRCGNMNNNVRRCIRAGMRHGSLPPRHALIIYKSFVKQAVMSGAEAWFPGSFHRGKLESAENSAMRAMVACSRTTFSMAMRGDLGLPSITHSIHQRCLTYFAKTLHRQDSALVKHILLQSFQSGRCTPYALHMRWLQRKYQLGWWREKEGGLPVIHPGWRKKIETQVKEQIVTEWNEKVAGIAPPAIPGAKRKKDSKPKVMNPLSQTQKFVGSLTHNLFEPQPFLSYLPPSTARARLLLRTGSDISMASWRDRELRNPAPLSMEPHVLPPTDTPTRLGPEQLPPSPPPQSPHTSVTSTPSSPASPATSDTSYVPSDAPSPSSVSSDNFRLHECLLCGSRDVLLAKHLLLDPGCGHAAVVAARSAARVELEAGLSKISHLTGPERTDILTKIERDANCWLGEMSALLALLEEEGPPPRKRRTLPRALDELLARLSSSVLQARNNALRKLAQS